MNRRAVRTVRFAGLLLLGGIATGNAAPPSATIDFSITHQTIDGFGGSTAFQGTPITDAQADMFFSTTSGIGLSWLRLGLNIYGDNLNGGYFPDAVKAAARGARIWAAPWSAQGPWKDNGNENNGGHLCAASGQGMCSQSRYDDWAASLAGFPAILKQNTGVDLYALSIQNEPDYTASYDSMLYSDAQFVNFIHAIGPKLALLNPRPLLMVGEYSDWQYLSGLIDAVQADATAASYTGIFATHQYVPQNVVPESAPKPIWETEMSSFEPFDAGIGHGITVAKWIHNAFTVGNVNVWHYWWLINPYNEDNEGLIGHPADPTAITKRYYTLGNFSKFVRPGFVRVDVSGETNANLYISAYKSAAGAFAIVVINDSGGDQPFAASVLNTDAIAVVPWVTSAGANLVAQPAVAITEHQFSATVAYGVTTFVGNADDIFRNGFEP